MPTPAQLERAFTKAGFEAVGKRLVGAAKPSVSVLRASTSGRELALGASKFNGSPDLPARAKWPRWKRRPLRFLGQINLTEATPIEEAVLLPASGLLSFFYEGGEKAWGFDPADRGAAVVIYTPPGARLRRHSPPAGASDDGGNVCALRFKAATTFPDIWGIQLTKAEEARYQELFRVFERTIRKGQGDDKAPLHRLLGHPFLVQGPMEEECQLVSNGVYLGGGEISAKDTARARRLKKGAKDWMLLLQLDSDDTASWLWGDSGLVYFWIRRQDLLAKDFSRGWCILQCY